MDKNEVQMASFSLVGYAGDAFSHFYEAVERAKEGDFEQAEQELAEGDAQLSEAHHAQTQMLVGEAQGEELPFSLMLVHGQDHLMTTIMYGRMAKQLIDVYKELEEVRHGA